GAAGGVRPPGWGGRGGALPLAGAPFRRPSPPGSGGRGGRRRTCRRCGRGCRWLYWRRRGGGGVPVGPPVFKTGGRRSPAAVGSTPMRPRHSPRNLPCMAPGELRPALAVSRDSPGRGRGRELVAVGAHAPCRLAAVA